MFRRMNKQTLKYTTLSIYKLINFFYRHNQHWNEQFHYSFHRQPEPFSSTPTHQMLKSPSKCLAINYMHINLMHFYLESSTSTLSEFIDGKVSMVVCFAWFYPNKLIWNEISNKERKRKYSVLGNIKYSSRPNIIKMSEL